MKGPAMITYVCSVCGETFIAHVDDRVDPESPICDDCFDPSFNVDEMENENEDPEL